MQQTIILIEDDVPQGLLIKSRLQQSGFEIIWFKKFENAYDYFDTFDVIKTPHVVAVIFDYMLDEEKNVTTVPLLQIVTDLGHQGPLIANSSHNKYNEHLLEMGCTHIRPGDEKIQVVDFVVRLISA